MWIAEPGETEANKTVDGLGGRGGGGVVGWERFSTLYEKKDLNFMGNKRNFWEDERIVAYPLPPPTYSA